MRGWPKALAMKACQHTTNQKEWIMKLFVDLFSTD